MTAPQTCKHCKGTTFCNGHRDVAGNIKFRPACTSCVVKSALNPKIVYSQVVCSVCAGTGVIQPGRETSRPRLSGAFIVLASALFTLSVLFLVVSIVIFQREANKYKDLAEKLLQENDSSNATLTRSELKARVAVGMTAAQVKDSLGEPESTKELGEGISNIELWIYPCADGRVQVALRDGTVRSVTP